MSRLYDWTLFIVITLTSMVIHTISVELFAPESTLHEIASQATQFRGAEKADLWFEVLAIWAPMIAVGGMLTWCLLREYRRQTVTGRATPARPP